MPTLSVEKQILFNHLGKSYTDEEFDELCFEFGVELDEITSELEEVEKSSTVSLSKKEKAQYSTNVIYKIDVPANRYDLLCVEGLSRGLQIFLGIRKEAPTYSCTTTSSSSSMITMTVQKHNTDTIRPFVVCAILRDITFNQERYNSFIDLQDQLHRNLCRQRTLVAIGTHDFDTIQPPFVYDARDPQSSIQFVPLTPSDQGSFTASKLLQHYEEDPSCKHLKPYVPIIKDSPLYPVIVDSNNTVLSLPPIINGDHSKITLQTKNVFIECTATDLTKANIVLDTVVTMFSEYCQNPFTVEPVQVNYVDQTNTIVSSYQTPLLSTRTEQASVEFCNSLIGISIPPEQMQQLCNKVQLGPAQLLQNNTILQVTVPPTRSDILHPVDIAEDIGIAYGYNNIVKKVPTTNTVGSENPLNQFSDLLREEIARAGYTEVLTHGLSSIYDNFTALQRPIQPAVSLLNPANIEYEVVRTSLLTGLLKTLQHNKSASFTQGFKLFEISDIVLPSNTHTVTETIVGAKNQRHVCAVYAGPTSGFEIIHGLVDRIMTLVEMAPQAEYIATSGTNTKEEQYRVTREGYYYTIQPLNNNNDNNNNNNNNPTTTTTTTKEENNDENNPPEAGTYFPGRAASILVSTPKQTKGEFISIGTFGIIHPKVLSNFHIQYPCSCMEFDLEPLL